MPAAAESGEGAPTDFVSDVVYLGTVKSYNDRRGFGFIACAETLAAYGRDVYMAKAEVQNAGDVGSASLQDLNHRGKQIVEIHNALRIAEEDVVRFQVRLSVEGYPQAANVQRLRKYRGVVLHPPPEDSSSSFEGGDDTGTLVSEELLRILGDREASIRQVDCGQVRLASGDEVTFCVPSVPSTPPGEEAMPLEAKQVVLIKTNRFARTILGCFSLRLPRPRVNHRAPRKDLRVDCHAFNDRIIIAGLPGDCDEAELRRFFSKQGATETIATRARGCGFASVSFPSMAEVAKLLSRTAHAFTDDKETQIATLHGRRTCAHPHADIPRLPALPSPSLMPGEIAGVLLVNWSPLVLAVSYVVELRPAGMRAAWQPVDGATGCLKQGGSRFDKDRSSCKVSGLDASSAYEARVVYYTSCGCKAEASDPSDRCIPNPGARVAAPAAGFQLGLAGAGITAVPTVFGGCWPGGAAAAALPVQMQTAPGATSWPLGLALPNTAGLLAAMPQAAGQAQLQALQAPGMLHGAMLAEAAAAQQAPMAASQAVNSVGLMNTSALQCTPVGAGTGVGAGQNIQGWRCPHGNIIPPPPVPEVHPADEYGFAISVQWPSVAHAAAYVVELREQGSSTVERFMRSAPMAMRGSIVELRVGGLRPAAQGQRYSAQVRCIADCGCESAPSSPGWSPVLGGAQPVQQPAQDSTPSAKHLCGSTSPNLVLETQQQGFVAAVGMPPWVSNVPTVQPTAVALFSQVLDPSPTALDANSAHAAAALNAAAMAAQVAPQQQGILPVAQGQSPQKAAPLAPQAEEMPPELTGCEECLLLD